MPSSAEDETTAAATQLGSMSLGESGALTNLCSACGEKSADLKLCHGCKCVWYCDTHWGKRRGRVHKPECKRIYKELGKRGGKLDLGTELDIGPLGKLVRNSAQHKKPAKALYNKALNYGLLLDQTKRIDLLRESADLGFLGAQYQLRVFYHNGEMGLEKNEEEAMKAYKEAAKGGHILAQHNLGVAEYANGDYVAAMRYWRLSASGGYRNSMGALIDCFEEGLLQHVHLSETLQTFYRSSANMKSKGRELHIGYLQIDD